MIQKLDAWSMWPLVSTSDSNGLGGGPKSTISESGVHLKFWTFCFIRFTFIYFLHFFLSLDEKARIQLRLPTSDRHIFEWPCTTKLKALKLYIPFKYPELTNDPYKVICPFVGGQSTNNILEMDDTLTLKEANLYPTAILHLRNED